MNFSKKESYQIYGRLIVDDQKSNRMLATIEFDKLDPKSLQIKLLSLEDDPAYINGISLFKKRSQNFIWFEPENPLDQTLEILGINGDPRNEKKIEVIANAIQLGINKIPFKIDTSCFVHVELSPSGILSVNTMKQFNDDGSIKINKITKDDITVSTSLGELKIKEEYCNFEDNILDNTATIIVQRAAITGSFTIKKGITLYSINELFLEELFDICLVLSLCYRKPVKHYEITYLIFFTENNKAEVSTRRVKLRSQPTRFQGIDELINIRELCNDGFDILLKSLKLSNNKERISRGISFLVASYEMSTLETSYFMVYSALECILGILCKDSKQDYPEPKIWKKISKALKKQINEILTQFDALRYSDDMKKKLPELTKKPIVDMLTKVCEEMNIKTKDLWPKEGLLQGFRVATKQRNNLFHSAAVTDIPLMRKDVVRLQILTERLILKVLSWPEDKIWKWYNQNLLRVNKS